MINLHDLVLSLADAQALAAMLDGHRRGHSADSDPAEALAAVLAQARRVSAEQLSSDRIAMGSSVTYVEEPSAVRRTVTLGYPAEADFAVKRISVLSPVGRALLGRRQGDVVDVLLPGRKLLEIHIVAVRQEREALREAA